MLTDIVNEFYGPSGARRLTFVGLGAAVFVWLVITLALHLPTSPQSPIPDRGLPGRVRHLGAPLRRVADRPSSSARCSTSASSAALRRVTGHRLLWLRATGSTVLSQAIDSFTVSFVFLAGTSRSGFITSNAANNYVGKLIMAVLLTPRHLRHSRDLPAPLPRRRTRRRPKADAALTAQAAAGGGGRRRQRRAPT